MANLINPYQKEIWTVVVLNMDIKNATCFFFFFSDETTRRPKSLIKTKSGDPDGADEKMLPQEKNETPNSEIKILDMKNEKQNGEAKLNIGEFATMFWINFPETIACDK